MLHPLWHQDIQLVAQLLRIGSGTPSSLSWPAEGCRPACCRANSGSRNRAAASASCRRDRAEIVVVAQIESGEVGAQVGVTSVEDGL
jgi:hypothetical protein